MTTQDFAAKAINDPAIQAMQAGSGLDHETFLAHIMEVIKHNAFCQMLLLLGHQLSDALMPVLISLLTRKILGAAGAPAITPAL